MESARLRATAGGRPRRGQFEGSYVLIQQFSLDHSEQLGAGLRMLLVDGVGKSTVPAFAAAQHTRRGVWRDRRGTRLVAACGTGAVRRRVDLPSVAGSHRVSGTVGPGAAHTPVAGVTLP